MKRILYIFIFLCAAKVAGAQNATEAKMAYQLAEEKFDAKQYEEALDFLKKAETALGKTNPPMAYLRVLIVDQLAYANEKTEKAKGALDDLEKALAAFETTPGKEALGDDKLMEVYRIKVEFQKRKERIQKEIERQIAIKEQYKRMVYRLAAEFPKTETTVRDFFAKMSTEWAEPRYGGSSYWKVTEKRMNKFIKRGGQDYFNEPREEGKIYLENLTTHRPGEDIIKEYMVGKVAKLHANKKDNIERAVTIEEICDLLKISRQMWIDFTTGEKPLIKTDHEDPVGYWILLKEGQKEIQIYLYGKTRKAWQWLDLEKIQIHIFENTF